MIKKENKKNNIEDVVANSCLGKRPVGPSGDRKNINIESLIHIVGNQTVEEWRSQFVTSNFAKMGLRRPPYAFTRNGIGMLSSVLTIADLVKLDREELVKARNLGRIIKANI